MIDFYKFLNQRFLPENIKKILSVIGPLIILSFPLHAQEQKDITVKAGTRVIDYFPVSVRYRYPNFTEGKLRFKNGITSAGRFNYNFLLGEMEFLQSRDTLSIADKKNIRLITVALDTFFYNNGYIEVISGGLVRVGLMQNIRLKSIERVGAYGTTDRTSSIDTYNSMAFNSNFYKLMPNEDWIFQKTHEYYFSTPGRDFVQFTRKNVLDNFPQKKDAIKEYLKTNKIDFSSRDDLLRCARYLSSLNPDKS